MKSPIFTQDGHIARWVFFPQAVGSEGNCFNSFSDEEKSEIFNHMKVCQVCKAAEIEATLHLAELGSKENSIQLIRYMPSGTSNGDSFVGISFDKYPVYLLDNILQFVKGSVITFDRDKTGRVEKITGVVDGEIESDIRFIYDGSTTTIHCYSHNCEDNSVSEQECMTFADLHIDHSKESLISFSLDATDFYPECNEIKRYHSFHKLFTDHHGRVIEIIQDNKPWYHAEYDDQQNLKTKTHGPISTEYRYADNRLILKKSLSNDELVEQMTFEYAEGQQGVVRIFSNLDSSLRLKALNFFGRSTDEPVPICLELDGVARYYYNSSGNLMLKVHLPHDDKKADKDLKLNDLQEIPEKFETVEMFLVDNESGDMRIIKKKEGGIYIDQTSKFENGLLCKVFNQAGASCTTVTSLHLANRHWSEIIEVDDISL